MKYRKSILDALNMLLDDAVQKIPEHQKTGKLNAWQLGLLDLTDAQIYFGLKKALSRSDGFLVNCGQFKELCITPEGVNSVAEVAYEAWNLAFKNLNRYTSPIFKNSAISEAIRQMGGWRMFCNIETKEIPFRKKEFSDIYSVLIRRGKEYDPLLIGTHKTNYIMIGYTEAEDIDQILLGIENMKNTEKKLYHMLAEAGK